MFVRVRQLKMLGGALALLACAVCSSLPMGLMPKVAGPCGRELCYCHEYLLQKVCCPEAATDSQITAPRLVLGQHGVDAAVPGLAFELVVSAFEMPGPAACAGFEPDSEVLRFDDCRIFLESQVREVILPPPRA